MPKSTWHWQSNAIDGKFPDQVDATNLFCIQLQLQCNVNSIVRDWALAFQQQGQWSIAMDVWMSKSSEHDWMLADRSRASTIE